ncbi:MAG: CDP-glycerol glycerophosphotransferase family protein [Clostridiales bacterium]|nr:CDP-glycerol glycerophosphotransferase family protein [Clostridiales bacterium]
MGAQLFAAVNRVLTYLEALMKYIKKIYNRFKSDGIKGSFVHYSKLLRNYLLSFILNLNKKVPIFKILPLRKIIVFECESDMDDNPRAIYEYMLNNKDYSKWKFVWIVKNLSYCKTHYKANRTVFVSRFTYTFKEQIRLNYYLAVGKYFLFSHPYWFQKLNKKQIVIHTEHGNPIKNNNSRAKQISECFDFLRISSKFFTPWVLKFWECPIDKTFICPHPKNDFLFIGDKKEIFSKLFNYQQDEKVIMCMPTFKQSKNMMNAPRICDQYSLSVINNKSEYEQLNRFLADNKMHLIIKLHPLQITESLYLADASNIHYIQNSELLNKKIILYSLVGCCDSLLTDFSSIFYDYILLDRPLAFFINNFDKYDRGFIIDNPMDFMCGELINTFDDLILFLEHIRDGVDIKKDDRHRINNLVNEYSGNACKQFVDIMLTLNQNLQNGAHQ